MLITETTTLIFYEQAGGTFYLCVALKSSVIEKMRLY